MMYHIFADDVQIYKSFKREDSIKSLLDINKDLKAIQNWAVANKLKLNVAKTQAIAISASNETRYLPPLWLNGLIVPYSDTVKNLGMIFNKKLDWKEHVDLVCDKIYKSLRSLWPRFSVTPQLTRVMMTKSLLMPHIEYCSIVYSHGLSVALKEALEKAFGSMIRFTYGVRKYDSIVNYKEKLLGFSLSKFFRFRASMFLYKLLLTNAPKYLSFLAVTGSSARTKQLKIPRNSTHYGNTLAVKGVVEWNALPIAIRTSRSIGQFRSSMMVFMKG